MKKYKEKIEEFIEKFNDFAEDHEVIATFCLVTVFIFLLMIGIVIGLGVAQILWMLMKWYSLFIIIPVIIGLIAGFLTWRDEL